MDVNRVGMMQQQPGVRAPLAQKFKFAAFSVLHAMSERTGTARLRRSRTNDALTVVLRLVEWLQVCALAVEHGWSSTARGVIRTVGGCVFTSKQTVQ